jgi:hypothetical protein
MALKDHLPSRDTALKVGGGVLAGGALVVMLGLAGAFQQPFEPNKDNCSTYFETRNGRFICVIAGRKEGPEAGIEKAKPAATPPQKDVPVKYRPY